MNQILPAVLWMGEAVLKPYRLMILKRIVNWIWNGMKNVNRIFSETFVPVFLRNCLTPLTSVFELRLCPKPTTLTSLPCTMCRFAWCVSIRTSFPKMTLACPRDVGTLWHVLCSVVSLSSLILVSMKQMKQMTPISSILLKRLSVTLVLRASIEANKRGHITQDVVLCVLCVYSSGNN